MVPVFLGGTGRSGTSVALQALLESSDIVGFNGETQFIVAQDGLLSLLDQGFSPAAIDTFKNNLFGRWYRREIARPNRQAYFAGLHKGISLDDLRFTFNEFINSQRNEQKAAEFVRKIFDLLPGADKVCCWCEKTPANLLFADRLFRLFPDMKFIHLVRDGRDVVTSILRNSFWPIANYGLYNKELNSFNKLRMNTSPREFTVYNAALYWRDTMTLGGEALSKVSEDNVLEVKLEDLVLDRAKTVSTISEFLEINLKEVFSEVDLTRSNIGYYQNSLTPDEIRTCNAIMGYFLIAYGYM